MALREQHISLPKLYNVSPDGDRRLAAMEARERPLGPDDLPIERQRSAEDQAIASALLPPSYTHQVGVPGPVPARAGGARANRRRPNPFAKAIADWLMRHGGTN